MTNEEIIAECKQRLEFETANEMYSLFETANEMYSLYQHEKDFYNATIKALEQNNEEIFKQFKKKVFLESEDVLGNEKVDSYMITDYLAELLGVGND